MDQRCPKCDFNREKNAIECPKCGIIYDKYFTYLEKKLKNNSKAYIPQKDYIKTGDEVKSDLLDFFDFISDVID